MKIIKQVQRFVRLGPLERLMFKVGYSKVMTMPDFFNRINKRYGIYIGIFALMAPLTFAYFMEGYGPTVKRDLYFKPNNPDEIQKYIKFVDKKDLFSSSNDNIFQEYLFFSQCFLQQPQIEYLKDIGMINSKLIYEIKKICDKFIWRLSIESGTIFKKQNVCQTNLKNETFTLINIINDNFVKCINTSQFGNIQLIFDSLIFPGNLNILNEKIRHGSIRR